MAAKPAVKKANPFGKPDTKKNEAAERKIAPSPKQYAELERKFENVKKGKKS